MGKFIFQVWSGIYNLYLGFLTTFKHLFRPAITIQYPEEKSAPFPAFRGNLKLRRDKCTSCLICVNYCPNYCIDVKYEIGDDKKRKLISFTVDMGKCMYCGLCVEVCPFSANYWDQSYERSVFDRAQLIERKDL